MEYRQASRADMAKIFRDCAKRMLIEYDRAGLNDRQVKSEFTKRVSAGQAHTLIEDGQPMAIIVWLVRDDTIETGFVAKEEFFSPRTVRFCRTHIRRIQRENGSLPLCSSSFSTHPRVPRWFKALGFIVGPSEPQTTNYWLVP